MKMRRLLAFSLACFLTLVPQVNIGDADDHSYLGHVDPALPEEEQKVIAEIMATLLPEDRDNVIYFASDGKVYANKIRLKEAWAEAVPVEGNLYRDEEGNLFPLPPH